MSENRFRIRLGGAILFGFLVGCGGSGGGPSVPAQSQNSILNSARSSTPTTTAVTPPVTQPPVAPPPVTPPPAPPPAIKFTDATVAAGITTLHQRTLEYFITGQAWGDYDGDGWLDLYLTRVNGRNDLYLNNQDGSFQVSPLSAQVALPTLESGGAVFVDYNNDGWKDLYVLNDGPNVLFKNNGGTGFTDVTAVSGLGDPGRGETAAWGDYDNDGHLDLFVANWGEPPDPNDALFHNNGDGTFSDVTSLLDPVMITGLAFTAAFVDYDNDGDLDIYLVNDKGIPGPDSTPLQRNALFRNDGPGPGGWTFKEVALSVGADSRVDGMGLGIADYNQDGHLDFAFSHSGPSVLLRNLGDGSFEDISAFAGIDIPGIGWGTIFSDFDADGLMDLYIAVSSEGNHVFRNLGNGTFEDVSEASGASDPGTSMGLAYADYDKDGRVDLIVGNQDSGYKLWRSEGNPDNDWISVRLLGSGAVNRDAVGSRVTLTRTDGRVQMQEVKCGSSLGSGNDLALHFGLADQSIQQIEVRWPDGLIQTFTGVTSNQELEFVHP